MMELVIMFPLRLNTTQLTGHLIVTAQEQMAQEQVAKYGCDFAFVMKLIFVLFSKFT